MNASALGQKLVRNRIIRAAIKPALPVTARPDMARFGNGHAGWWVPTSALSASSVVYSVGIGVDASFDVALIERFGCQVWGFDPTPESVQYVARSTWPPQWHFDAVGLWVDHDQLTFSRPVGQTTGSASITRPGNADATFLAPVEPLTALMSRHGHEHIDLLKMDIEGAEGQVLEALIESPIRPTVLCIEYDQPEAPWSLVARIRRLLAAGYELNNVDGWNYTFSRA